MPPMQNVIVDGASDPVDRSTAKRYVSKVTGGDDVQCITVRGGRRSFHVQFNVPFVLIEKRLSAININT